MAAVSHKISVGFPPWSALYLGLQVRVLAATETEYDNAQTGENVLLTPDLYIATNRFNTKPNKVFRHGAKTWPD